MVYLEIPKMSEKTIEEGIAGVVRTYKLMDRVRTRRDLVFRDDQFDYPALVDAARYAGRRRIRLSLLDTGRFSVAEVEALARTGARILTSDEARPRAGEWEILLKACRESRTHLSVFWNGPLPAGDDATAIPLRTLEDLLERGMDLHVSDRTHARDAGTLGGLADGAKKGRGYLVLYHLGPLVPELAGTAGRRAWIHLSDRDALDASWAGLAVAIARAAAASGARALVHVERGLPLELLEELWSAGAGLIFLTPPSDRRSLLRPVERKAARRRLPARAFHLSTAFMP
jgi:hypothetical protein